MKTCVSLVLRPKMINAYHMYQRRVVLLLDSDTESILLGVVQEYVILFESFIS